MDYEVGQIVFPVTPMGWKYGIIKGVEKNKYLLQQDGVGDPIWMNKVLLHLQSRLDFKRSREIKIDKILNDEI